ncbi:MAG: hypothetical protein ACJ8C4_15000 [Gemmataceae bacterium]
MILGLRTVCYPTPDLATGKTWYARAFETEPYFVEPYYVGFQIGGFELGLILTAHPARPAAWLIGAWPTLRRKFNVW